MFSKEDLGTLMTADPSWAVSIFLPTHMAGREIRQDPIRLKNQLDDAEERLTEAGLRTPEARAILAPARELTEDYAFWRHQQCGLALFLAPNFFRRHEVPIDLPELVAVGKRFHVKPLLPVFAADGRFFVLAATAGRVRLFEASRFGIAEEKDTELPESMAALYGETDYEQMVHANPVARPHAGKVTQVPKAQNFGETAEELRKTQTIEFVRRLAHAVEGHLGDYQAPLVLAAEPEIEGHFRQLYKSKNLVPDGLEINPDAVDEQDLHRRAYEIVQPHFTEAREAAIGEFQSMCGNDDPRATGKFEEIVEAARFGRIDTLFLAADERIWGRFDETANKVVVDETPRTEDIDLLDYAAVQTLLHGGPVYLMERNRVPRQEPAAAILRWGHPGS